MLRHRPICKMTGLFSDFSLGDIFDPDGLYNLENEYENKLLASIDIENAVRNNTNNSVIESEISEQVPDKDTEPRPVIDNRKSNEIFLSMSNAEIDEVITRTETNNAKRQHKMGYPSLLKVSFML